MKAHALKQKFLAGLLLLAISLIASLNFVRERYQLAFRLRQKAVQQILHMSEVVSASNLSESEKTRILRELLDAMAIIAGQPRRL